MILYSRRGALSSKFILGKWGGDALVPVPGKSFLPFCSFNEWNELGVGAKLFFFHGTKFVPTIEQFLKICPCVRLDKILGSYIGYVVHRNCYSRKLKNHVYQ